MFIAKLSLPRRTFLGGMGAAIALPFLDAMVPALTATARTAANPAPRSHDGTLRLAERAVKAVPAGRGVPSGGVGRGRNGRRPAVRAAGRSTEPSGATP